jgi:SAM-dependent methyltransferase
MDDTLRRVPAPDAAYLEAAAAEAAYWDQPQFFGTGLSLALPVESPLQAYESLRFTGDPHRRWFDTIADYGRFETALFLGVNAIEIEARILGRNPLMRATFLDISEGSLARRREDLSPRFPGRVSTISADFNFAELEPDAYDAVISMSTLHHVQNIEWVAAQLLRALRPGGVFFLHDYVGEDRFAFRATRRKLLEVLIERGKRNGAIPQSWRVAWPVREPWVYSPFEAIRSEDTLAVLARTLEEVHVGRAGAVVNLLPLIAMDDEDARRWERLADFSWKKRPHASWRRAAGAISLRKRPAMSAAFLDELMLIDSLALDSGLVPPTTAFAVYRRPN